MKPRIVMIEISGAGGISHYTVSLLEKLATKAEATLYTGQLEAFGRQLRGVEIHEIFRKTRTNPFDVGRMFLRLWRLRPDAVHFQVSQAPGFMLVMVTLCRLLRLKVVVTAHNVLPHEAGFFDRPIFRALYRMANAIIVHSAYSARELLDLVPVSPAKLYVIDHGNYMLFRGQTLALPPATPALRILFFGYIRRYKGLDVLLAALGRVDRERYPVSLRIVGKPVESFAAYGVQIEELGLSGFVHADLKYVPDGELASAFMESDCVVLPYRHISQSGVLQLAYAFGKPVIATRVGGLPEVVEDDASGFIVEPEDIDGLARAIERLAADRGLLARLSARAEELARTRFDWDSISTSTLEVYR